MLKESEFNVWQWIISKEYITSIKQIIVTSNNPVAGYITFGSFWYVINQKDTIDKWLNNNWRDKIKYQDIIELSRELHPISTIARKLIQKYDNDFIESIKSVIEVCKLNDIDGLISCLHDTNNNPEFERIRKLAPDYIYLDDDIKHDLIRYSCDSIVTQCFDSTFVPKSITTIKILESNDIYGIFLEGIQKITERDNIMWIQGGFNMSQSIFLNRSSDKIKFSALMKNWIPNISHRELLKKYVRNLIYRLPWDTPLKVDLSLRNYQPYYLLKHIFHKIDSSKDIIYVDKEVSPSQGNMYIYVYTDIIEENKNIGYNIEVTDQSDIIINDRFLQDHLGCNYFEQAHFFEKDEYLLFTILWCVNYEIFE